MAVAEGSLRRSSRLLGRLQRSGAEFAGALAVSATGWAGHDKERSQRCPWVKVPW